jgi:hypothetical protein
MRALISGSCAGASDAPLPIGDCQSSDGLHPPERQQEQRWVSRSTQALVDLGYIAPLEDDTAAAVRSCMTENRYNLARAHMDAGDLDAGAELLSGLIAEDNEQIRYHQHLFQCRLAERRYQNCAQMLDALGDTCSEPARGG